ncbi:hypothetical protein ACSS31_26940 (plasmid) [Priestia megaterium]
MSDAKLGQEPAYWTSEVAKKLEVSDSTLRKWCIQLEATGYKFVKGENDSRAFTKHDLKALQLFKQIVKVQRKTKEVASLEVVERYGARQGTPPCNLHRWPFKPMNSKIKLMIWLKVLKK